MSIRKNKRKLYTLLQPFRYYNILVDQLERNARKLRAGIMKSRNRSKRMNHD